ncbi:MAG: lipopolysaccharide kinase InaA family protein, partial [Thermodesulfobacteriota bacterium]|nr:lipopolysaccharide kinase InaA family protein [Thermodesulfobacteriota bacterium]
MQLEGFNTRLFDNERWFIKQDASLILEEELIPILSSSSFFQQAVPIKKGKHKSLWRYVSPAVQGSEAYLIKRYQTKHLLGYLKTLATPSKALQELKAAHGIDRRGIPTPVPVAIGEKLTWKMVKESYVVLRELQNCQALNSYFLQEYPAAKSPAKLSEKRKVIKTLGNLAEKAHREGIFQSDFSLNNFLLTRDNQGTITILMSDFEKITLKNSLSSRQQITCLAKLNRVGREISLADRMRFLKAYVGDRASAHHLVSLGRTIQKRTIELLKQDYLRGRVTSVYTDALYEKFDQENSTGYFKRGYKAEDILEVIRRFDLMAKSHPSAEVREREEIAIEITLNGTAQQLRAVRYISQGKTLPARALWTKISTLVLAGLPLELPHVFMEVKVKNNHEGYLFMPQRKNEVDLKAFLTPSREKQEILMLIESLAMLLRKLHYFGVFSD